MAYLSAVTLSHSKGDFVPAPVDGYTSNSIAEGLKCMDSAHIQRGSAKGAETQETSKQGDNDDGDDDDDGIATDEYGCPDLTKETFLCSWCGGKDDNGKCKGDPEDNNLWAGCICTPDPDWSLNPPGLRRPQYREHQRAIRDRHDLRDDGLGAGTRGGNRSILASATILVSARAPLETVVKLCIPHFGTLDDGSPILKWSLDQCPESKRRFR
ncbi:hypothetical protein K505DRAFT_337121 [Melanomma pulvis-pyrius CBS 109.77]|uniref:Uncharacterized protein n=1 Tax=Melanomma pulvis-pyrius CBS 109.77 TaxID=1314802 RepID=A0A6A6XCL6_9PLEO|nr:hypothetical protein K505DRAFT_337121 [Melanomma pulvis-pyrius CBS 109.77]